MVSYPYAIDQLFHHYTLKQFTEIPVEMTDMIALGNEMFLATKNGIGDQKTNSTSQLAPKKNDTSDQTKISSSQLANTFFSQWRAL